MKRKLFSFLFVVAAIPAANAGELLSGQELHAAVAGKTVHIYTPLGEVPVKYAANGGMSARTELALLDGEDRTSDHGHWWVDHNKLCIRWQNWMGAAPHCFTMLKVGAKVVRWYREDGKAGIARLD